MKKSMAVLFPAGIVLAIVGASAKAAAPLTPYPATAVVTNDASGDGLLNDGHDTYVHGELGVQFFDVNQTHPSSLTMSDRFFIQNGGRNPKRTLYLKTPGGELIVCSTAQFQLDSSSNRDWFNMVPGDPAQAGRAFLSCNKSKNERYLLNWPAAPELPDCAGMITRVAGEPPQFRFVSPDGCTASVRRYDGGQLRSLMAFDIPFDVTATVDTSG